jgi:hypothetical protein
MSFFINTISTIFLVIWVTIFIIFLAMCIHDLFLNSRWFYAHPQYGIPFFRRNFFVTQMPDGTTLHNELSAILNPGISPKALASFTPLQRRIIKAAHKENEVQLNIYDSETLYYYRLEGGHKIIGRVFLNKSASQVEVTGYFVWPSFFLHLVIIGFWILAFPLTFLIPIFVLPNFFQQKSFHREVGDHVKSLLMPSSGLINLKRPNDDSPVKIVLSGLLFFVFGLISVYFLTPVNSLQCSRVEEFSTVSCVRHTKLFGLIPISQLQINNLQSVRVDESCSDNTCSYRLYLDTPEESIPYSRVGRGVDSRGNLVQNQAEKIQYFLLDKQAVTFMLNPALDEVSYSFLIPLVFILGGVSLVSHGLQDYFVRRR